MLFDPSGREISQPMHVVWFVLYVAVGSGAGMVFGWKVARVLIDLLAITTGNGQVMVRLGLMAAGCIVPTWILIQRRKLQWREWTEAYAKAYAPIVPRAKTAPSAPVQVDVQGVEYFPDLPTAVGGDNQAPSFKSKNADAFVSQSSVLNDPTGLNIATPNLIAAFVGPNANSIVPKMLRGADGKFAWSWPAFLFAPIYLAYRKMYGPLALFWAVAVVTTFLEEIIGRNLTALNGGVFVGFGVAFYRLYWKRYERAFTEARAGQLESQRIAEILKAAGGVSLVAGVTMAIVMILMLLAGVAAQ